MRTQHQILPILAHVSKRVGNVEVIELGIGIPLPDRRSQIIRGHVQKGKVVRDERCVAVVRPRIFGVALHGQVGFQGWDIYLFVVRAGVDEECLRVGGCG